VAAQGKVYLIGGWSPVGGELAHNEQYDPGTGAVFTGLFPNSIYYFRAKARNVNGYETPESVAGTTHTLAAPPTAQPFDNISSTTLTAHWDGNSNPGGTTYVAILSTAPSPATNGAAGN